MDLEAFRSHRRIQELVFDFSRTLTRERLAQGGCQVPPHILFPQVAAVAEQFLEKKVVAYPPADKKDLFLAPYFGWAIEILRDAIQPDTSQGEAPEIPVFEAHRGPGSTADVDFWTSRDVREVQRCHLNYIVADTKRWEQSAAYYLDTSDHVEAFAKSAGMGFAIPYLHNGQMHDYVPDWLVRLNRADAERPVHLILETKGYDPLKEVKEAAARRWVDAVNADGRYGLWLYDLAGKPTEVPEKLVAAAQRAALPARNRAG